MTAPKDPELTGMAIFDLDRTLVPGSSLVPLGRELVRRELVNRRFLARHAWSAAAFSRRGLDTGRTEAVQGSLLAALAGRSHAELAAVARDVGRDLVEAVYPGARWLIDRHLGSGDFCVILTAAPQELAAALAGALGVHRAIGTRLEIDAGRFTGGLDGGFCHGEGKVQRLTEELGVEDLTGATAYGDSISDLPVLERAGDPVAVNPDRALARHAHEHGWPTLQFGT